LAAAQRRSEQLRQLLFELAASEPLYSKDAAFMWGLSEAYIRRLCRERKVGLKIGTAWIISGRLLRELKGPPPELPGALDPP
jgi:hypothetical protein